MPPEHVSPTRVLIASPRMLVRSALAALVRGQPQIDLVGTTADAAAQASACDVLIWDVLNTQPRLLPVRFIVLLAERRNARAWLDAGAPGVLLETSSVEELLDGVRQVAAGEMYFPANLIEDILPTLRALPESAPSHVEPLTDREREVLALLAQGSSNKDIAQKLYLSVRTVEGHLANIYGKLQVKSRTEAALWVLQNR